MPSHKQNTSLVRDCPEIDAIVSSLQAQGMAPDAACGVADTDRQGDSVVALFVVRSETKVKRFDDVTAQPYSVTVNKDDLTLFRLTPHEQGGTGTLETYDGGAKARKELGEFIATELLVGMGVAVEPVLLDPVAAFHRLQSIEPSAALVGARIAGYSTDAEAVGPFAPRFASNDAGIDFLNLLPEEGETGRPTAVVKSVKAAWKRDNRPVRVSITPDGCVTFSCNEADEEYVREVVREVVGHPRLWRSRDLATLGQGAS